MKPSKWKLINSKLFLSAVLTILGTMSTFLPNALASNFRPFVEYEKVGKIFIGTTDQYDISATQKALIENMPDNVEIFIFSGNSESLKNTESKLKGTKNASKVHYLNTDTSTYDLWARDILTYPLVSLVHSNNTAAMQFQYFNTSTPSEIVNKLLNIPVLKSDAIFEGGNLVADIYQNCFAVEMPELESLGKVPVQELIDNVGCKRVFKLPFQGGIGHADERLLFISNKLAATDIPEIADQLKKMNYEVLLLPYIENKDFSYLNSVIVNGTIFVPTFELPTDNIALNILAKSGLKIVSVPSKTLTENGSGSIHCISRTYPAH